MANVLRLEVDTSGAVTKAYINENDVGTVVTVSQSLTQGALRGSLTLIFDTVTIASAPVVPAPLLNGTYAADGNTGTTVTVTDTVGSGNHFAYKYGTTATTTPNVGDVVTGITTITGSSVTIPVTAAGNHVAIYEVTATNAVVKFADHQLDASEVGDGGSSGFSTGAVPAAVGKIKVGALS